MGKQQAGFTLIELIAVIVILGILAATAVPRFVNLQDEAALAAVRGVAGGIESGSALNHAVDLATEAGLTSDTFYDVATCADGSDMLNNGALPSGYTIGDTGTPATTAVADKATVTCVLVGTSGATANFVLIGALN